MDEESEQNTSVKLVMIGETNVGKTTLISRWITNVFDPDETPTVGGCYLRQLTIDGKKVDLFLWDTAGQEEFNSIVPMYLRKASVVIVTVSIDRISSFQEVNKWIDMAHERCEGAPLVLAVNKMDLQSQIDESEIENKYGDDFSQIFYVSALNGSNVSNLFVSAGEQGYRYVKSSRESQSSMSLTQWRAGNYCC